MLFFFDEIGEATHQTQTSLLKKVQTIRIADAGSIQHFLYNGLQRGGDRYVVEHGEKFEGKGTNELGVLGIFPTQPKQAIWIVFKD